MHGIAAKACVVCDCWDCGIGRTDASGAAGGGESVTANNYLFDIVPNAGYVANGGIPDFSEAYDSWFSLQVGAQGFVGSGSSTPDGGRTVFCHPATLSGLSVYRKAYVPAAGGDFCRFFDSFTNNTASPISVTVQLGTTAAFGGSLGSDRDTIVPITSDGDAVIEAADTWFVSSANGQPFDPELGHVLHGPGAATVPTVTQGTAFGTTDRFTYTYDLTLAPGQTQSLLHFEIQQSGSLGRTYVAAEAERLSHLPADALAHLNAAEVASVVNFVPEPTAFAAALATFLMTFPRRRCRSAMQSSW